MQGCRGSDLCFPEIRSVASRFIASRGAFCGTPGLGPSGTRFLVFQEESPPDLVKLRLSLPESAFWVLHPVLILAKRRF